MNKININKAKNCQYNSSFTSIRKEDLFIKKTNFIYPFDQIQVSNYDKFEWIKFSQILMMQDKEESQSPFFSTPFKNISSIQLKNHKGILDSSSEKIKLNENNPFVTFAGSESIEKSSIKLEKEKESSKKDEQEVSEEKSQSDRIFQNWRNLMRKSKKANKNEKKKCELKFTNKERKMKGKIGKLLFFTLNEKNSQNLAYSPAEGTAVSIPFCKNCKKVFENFAAVGGHRRVCRSQKRAQRSKMIVEQEN